jgi:hypothetical protein
VQAHLQKRSRLPCLGDGLRFTHINLIRSWT